MINYVNVYTKKDISLKNGMWVLNDNGQLATGLRKSFYGDGTVQDETTLLNGINNGIQKVYDPKGNLWFENVWKNGSLVSFKKIN